MTLKRRSKNSELKTILAALLLIAAAPASLSRTPDGHPDLQGFWENAALTPLERPAALGDRAFFTEAEAADYESPTRTVERVQAKSGVEEAATSGEVNTFWRIPKVLERDRRASLIVEPANGRLPLLSPWAKVRRDERATSQRAHLADNPEELSLAERCLVLGADPPLIPVTDNNVLQIVQTRGTVMILHEMMHDARLIPLDGRPHLPAAVAQWKGDPRGHWDGDTLVVDTTNFTDQTRLQGSGTGLHVVERFTRTNPDTLRYDFSVEDAASFAAPWAGRLSMTRIKGPIYEYACHEGNYSMPGILRGARLRERDSRKQ